jgi:hypothetical protein
MFSVMVDGKVTLDKKHQYYAQIQGQLHITGTDCCDLIVWTPQDIMVVRVARDDAWRDNISKLIEFYFQEFIFW